LKLNGVEIVVYDEADRLFEMGFAEQIKGLADRMPKDR
jgi:ATP-dependent RNA helicase DDX54/DBP10